MVAIFSGVENVHVKYGMKGNVCTFEAAASGFKIENVRSYPGRGCSELGFVGFCIEWCMDV